MSDGPPEPDRRHGDRRQRPPWPILVVAGLALFAGIVGGLQRFGWTTPGQTDLAFWHGALLVSGFFGTLIGIERAVAFGGRRVLAGPALSALGALALLVGLPVKIAAALFVAASLLFLALSLVVAARERAPHAITAALGAACWLYGNALWLTGVPPLRAAVPWLAFLVLTIAAERLDLSRLMPGTRWRLPSFGAAVLVIATAAVLEPQDLLPIGALGLGLIAMAFWLARFDILRVTIREPGRPRFVALCLVAGYIWLGIGGALMIAEWRRLDGPALDIALHALFLGFVLSMVFAHAGTVLPAAIGLRLPFTNRFYLAVILLQASVLVRLFGNGFGNWSAVAASGLISAAAIGLFVGTAVFEVWRAAR